LIAVELCRRTVSLIESGQKCVINKTYLFVGRAI